MAQQPQNVLVIGSGGREHAIVWKLSQSPRVAKIYVAPGNAGIVAEKNVTVANVSVTDFTALAEWCQQNNVTFVVVGPEDYLSQGIVDELSSHGISVFGPRRAAAQIEASKHFSKAFMDRHHIPTGRWRAFQRAQDAKTFIQETEEFEPLVVKASGLATGKGVVVAKNRKEAAEAVDFITEEFEDASETIIVEELLEGEEVSLLAFSDGNTTGLMIPAQDHKRLKDGDAGPNTGGMGAYCPCPLLSDDDIEFVNEKIIKKTILGLKGEGVKYVGVLYAGLMITKDGPKVLEFNCRFGDPETQVVLPLLETDLFDVIEACVNGQLDTIELKWIPNTFCVGVVMASAGYPGGYVKGKEVTGLDEVAKQPGHVVFHAGTKSVDNKFVTSGGRVLIAVALAQELAVAAAKAHKAVQTIQFEGAQYRTDIASKGIARSLLVKGQMTYKGSGVDIDAGDSFVKNILALTNSTKREGCMGNIGSFGGFFDTKAAGYKDPYLVSGTDGVGTKVKISEAVGIYDTVGIDLVAMCVNDILAHAAEPLFFLDYFATGKLDIGFSTKLIIGIAEGCRQAGCALIGGETAEMPGVYTPGTYDLAGFAVGAVERGKQLPFMDKIQSGDIVLGLSSSGPHSNGYSLIRRIAEKSDLKYTDPCPFSTENKVTLGEALLTPTKIYVKAVLPVLRSGKVKAFAHITGGGLLENIPRVLPKNLGVEIDARKWPIPPVFGWIAGAGGVNEIEMMRTFNCGLGAIMIVSPSEQAHVMSMITDECHIIGHVKDLFGDEANVQVKNFPSVMAPLMKPHTKSRGSTKRVGVLISGSGTNLQALIDHVVDPNKGSMAEIALVISNKPDAQGLLRAKNAGIPTLVINHKEFPSREDFDSKMTAALEKAHVDFVCLAGFMRILSNSFVRHWRGRLINIHPSLLPSFKGGNAHELVLQAGVRISGCTVHFVEEEVDGGAIIAQESVPVLVGDTVPILQERVKTVEHVTYPKALELLARNKVSLDPNGKIRWNL